MAAADPVEVSVVVPAHQAAATVGETVRSALAQTERALEVIVVDDGSTDGTAGLVRAEMGRDPRLRLVRQENAGVSAARNRGIAEARGRFVAILDADDIWHPEKIARQLAAMRRGSPRVALVYCRFREIDAQGRVLRSPVLPAREGEVYAPLVLVNFMGGGSGALMRRDALEAVGGFDTTLRGVGAEDIMLFLRMAERCEVALADAFLLGYRRGGDSMSDRSDRMLQSARTVLGRARADHPELPARLFRWAEGETLAWLATEALYAGRLRAGLPLLARAALTDPGAAVTRRTAHALGVAARRLARPLRRKAQTDAPAAASPDLPHFLDLEPEDGLDAAPALDGRMARRWAAAARFRLDRPAAPQGE